MGVAFSREQQDLFKIAILLTTILVSLVLVNTYGLRRYLLRQPRRYVSRNKLKGDS